MFIYHYIKNPRQMGAICQSSKRLSNAITSNINIEKAKNIIEIGAGTGVFTQTILSKKNPNANFFAIEINPKMAAKLSNKVEKLDIEVGSASNLTYMMNKRGMKGADAIISGIPWAMLKKMEQKELLEEIYNALNNGGYFTTFAYILPTIMATNFKNQLINMFGANIRTSKIVWQNIPPAFVYYCRK
ncbi:class I SAM-dependent methyltransferase [Helicobacter sp. MIT 14-3879]|uniref:class I SAM-dependent methyltransferase n=1 Tax=Helicobacter sp. MIT 14-3879 TaxID=2040649 RepID=UPI000E1F4EE0|nr:methyltransferase domain-containing protein [Helicobacter sp. MIT 14-3879]RDU64020.1 SAM-dependent methyltransferase [Helicobacter sp. MIT 14-3879]